MCHKQNNHIFNATATTAQTTHSFKDKLLNQLECQIIYIEYTNIDIKEVCIYLNL